MILTDYQNEISRLNFNEYPDCNTGTELVSKLLDYEAADAELKLYLAQLIFTRSFYGTYTAWYPDVVWYIKGFFSEYKTDKVKPWLSGTIREAAMMILSEETFTEGVIGTTFMFGVLEFYAKHHLGFRPNEFNFFDPAKKHYVQQYTKRPDLTIKSAFEHLQLTGLSIAKILNEVDAFKTSRLSVPSAGFTPHKIAERLNLTRNPMLHGETHSFYQAGPYLVMLYILFYLTDAS